MDTPQPLTIAVKTTPPKPHESDLYQRIQAFQLDDPTATYPFSAKLAHENDWSQNYTRRVIQEYKRFVYLTQVTEHMVSPSEAVDQAWHLHITYTLSYWEEFCPKVLQKTLHHHPSKGGNGEQGKFYDLYKQTLVTYRQVFAEDPPPDIWHAPIMRFGDDFEFQRINVKKYWIFPKLPMDGIVLWICGWVVTAVMILPVSLTQAESTIASILIGVVGLGMAYLSYRRMCHAQNIEPLDKIELTPYEAACLAGGPVRVIDTAIVRLVAQESFLVVEGKPSTISPLNPAIDLTGAYPFELKIHQLVHSGGMASSLIGSLREHSRDEVIKINRELKRLGLLLEDSQQVILRLICGLFILSSALLAGLLGIVHQDKVSVYLALAMGITYVFWLAKSKGSMRTAEGNELLNWLKTRSDYRQVTPRDDWSHRLKPGLESSSGLKSSTSAINPYSIALFGTPILAGTSLSFLVAALKKPSSGWGSSSGDGGCGGCGGCGGDGGDGCGGDGCGGCGGE